MKTETLDKLIETSFNSIDETVDYGLNFHIVKGVPLVLKVKTPNYLMTRDDKDSLRRKIMRMVPLKKAYSLHPIKFSKIKDIVGAELECGSKVIVLTDFIEASNTLQTEFHNNYRQVRTEQIKAGTNKKVREAVLSSFNDSVDGILQSSIILCTTAMFDSVFQGNKTITPITIVDARFCSPLGVVKAAHVYAGRRKVTDKYIKIIDKHPVNRSLITTCKNISSYLSKPPNQQILFGG